MNDTIRLGVVGIGNQGGNYLKSYQNGKLAHIEITAVADIDERKFANAREKIPGVACFDSAEALFASGLCDAAVIATPHYFHPPMVIAALNAGLHVLSEKPAGVYTKQVREAIAVAEKSDKTYAMMFNQRTNPVYIKLKELIDSGRYGEMRRMSWIITAWYRPQAYYNSGSWRATWEGEGGGVMLNQSPHQLDLWQWLCGMPVRVSAFCHEGKWHNIEVEDDVTIYAEYANGATGTFITSTGDWPGSNRLELTFDRAKIVCEKNDLTGETEIRVGELSAPLSSYTYETPGSFDKPAVTWQKIEAGSVSGQHEIVLNAFARHILYGDPLVAEGKEGINGLMISNAAFLSAWRGEPVTLPIDEDDFYERLQQKIARSTYRKVTVEQVQEDMSGTF